MTESSFWMSWIGLWLGILSCLITLLHSATESHRTELQNYINGSPIPSQTVAAISISSKIADNIFGKYLFYKWGFMRSIGFSIIIFIICFFVAYETTPSLQILTSNEYKDYSNTIFDTKSVSSISPTLIILFCFLSMAFEYIYVAKSRFILRYIKNYMSIYKVVFIWTIDIVSTLGLFITITPLIIILTTKSLDVFVPNIHDNVTLISIKYLLPPENWSRGLFIEEIKNPATTKIYDTYKVSIKALYDNVLYHINNWFTPYCTLTINRSVNLENSLSEEIACRDLQKNTPNAPCIKFEGVTYLTTTMLATAFGTNIWITLCALILIGYRIVGTLISGARYALMWPFDHPLIMVFLCIACIPICLISGLIITKIWFTGG